VPPEELKMGDEEVMNATVPLARGRHSQHDIESKDVENYYYRPPGTNYSQTTLVVTLLFRSLALFLSLWLADSLSLSLISCFSRFLYVYMHACMQKASGHTYMFFYSINIFCRHCVDLLYYLNLRAVSSSRVSTRPTAASATSTRPASSMEAVHRRGW
jgi:hypothetical protein